MGEATENVIQITTPLTGRKEIQTSETEITVANVCAILSQAYMKHLVNKGQIEYLYKYYKGDQPVIHRIKEIRPEICNHIVENRANAIVTFRVGYTVGKPIQYVSSVSDDAVSDAIARLNDMMRIGGKASKDKQLVEWQMICGTGYRMILPKKQKNPKLPFDFWTADPRQTFVIYQNDIGHTPLAGVYYTVADNQDITFHVYTDNWYYRVDGWQSGKVAEEKANPVGQIPIIEYPLNMSRLGAFEVVLCLLDALNDLESNRMDSVAQFVQSLLIAVNCEFPDDTTANDIREAGMVALRSIGENKADIKVISEALDQQQTQTLKQSILDAIYEIAGIPSQSNGNTSDSSNNGAVILKNGWQGAETRAQDFEQMFREPEQKFLGIACYVCDQLSDLTLDPYDVDIKFTRRNYEDILSKSQTLTTMLGNDKIHPQCAYEASGLFVDVQEAYNMGMEWFKKQQAEAKEKEEMALEKAKADAVSVNSGKDNKPGEKGSGDDK